MTGSSNNAATRVQSAFARLPLVAILRGLRPDEAVDIVEALFAAGVRLAEVPLNSPEPFKSISRLVQHFGDRMVIGAGTVTTVEQAQQLGACGGQICVAPNSDAAVINAALSYGMVPMPGFLTPTEAFVGYAAGARYLKFFPASQRLGDLSSMQAVLPGGLTVLAVGGVTVDNLSALRAAGASGVGIGTDLYRPAMSAQDVHARALGWAAAVRQSFS